MNQLVEFYNKLGAVFSSPKKIYELLLTLFIFSIPFSKRILLYDGTYSSSQLDPFSSIFLGLSDVLVLFIFVFWTASIFKGENKIEYKEGNAQQLFWLIILILYFFFVLSAFYSFDKNLVFLKAIFLLPEMFVFYLLANGYFKINKAMKIFIFSMVFQVLIAILQYYLQHSVGFSFLGEASYDQLTQGIARIEVNGEKFIRSYGSFLHPNILGGFCLCSATFSYYFWKKNKEKMWIYLSVVLLAGMLISFSRSALVGFLIALIFINGFLKSKVKKIFTFKKLSTVFAIILVLSFSSDFGQIIKNRIAISPAEKSVSERLNYMNISYAQILNSPWGVGGGQFTTSMQNFTEMKLQPWEKQPVHNVFLLIASELGIVALMFLIAFLLWLTNSHYLVQHEFTIKRDKNLNLMIIFLLIAGFTIALFDHYFATSVNSLYLIAFIAAISVRILDKNKKLIRKIGLKK